MRDLAIMFMETHYAPFAELLHSIRTGQPAAEHLYGQPFFTWLSHHPEQASRFTGAMANLTSGFKTAAITSLPLDGTRTIVDVGGADGTVLAAILAAHPHIRGVLFDLPHIITSAPKTLASHGIDDRADCVGGDFFESVPAGGDAYLVLVVLHDWPDQQAQHILANIAAAGGSGARLLLLEFVAPPGDTPHPSKMSDLNMLAIMGGKERTETEWREPSHGCICECIDSPLCRHHHWCKQAQGWHLEQPEPERADLAHPVGPHLRHQSHRVPHLAAR